MTRDTTTGTNYETEVENLLEDYSDHTVESQVMVGTKRNGGKHYCDIVLNEDELISLKYQRVQGTAEEKIPFEFMKLQHAIDDHGYKSATIGSRAQIKHGSGKITIFLMSSVVK